MTNVFPLLTTGQGFLILGIYTIIALVLTTIFSKGYGKTKESFLVANRKLSFFQGTMSVTAAWIWAPAMFISCYQGYVNGLSGFFWMFLGNLLSLILFGIFAPKIKSMYPGGFTLSGLMKQLYGSRVQFLFITELFLLVIGALAVNILAGSMAIYTVTGINFHLITIIIPIIALSYTLRGGLKASVITEVIKVVVFISIWTILTIWAIHDNGGMHTVLAGIGGKTGKGSTLFGNDFAINALVGFGIPTVLSLLSGTWSDNAAYQRVFAIEAKSVRKAYITAAFIAISITLFGGLIGMLAAGAHIAVPGEFQSYANMYVFGLTFPTWVFPILMFAVFASLISVIDSQLGTASSLVGDDFYNFFNKEVDDAKVLAYSRWAMVAVSAAVIAIVNIPHITLLEIFLLYGLSRATVWIPTMITILRGELLDEFGMFWGILLAWCTGMPLYIYGAFFGGGNTFILSGTLTAIFGSAIIGTALTRFRVRAPVLVTE